MRYPLLLAATGLAALTAACSPSGDTSAPNDATVPLETPARPRASATPAAATPAETGPTTPAVDSQTRPRPAEVKMFGAWAVACDNGAVCTAVSMAPDDAAIAEAGVTVTRGPAPNAPVTITIGTPAAPAKRIALAVDGRTLATGNADATRSFTVTGPVALTLARALATGTEAVARVDGRSVPFVITGAAAALRYADAAQSRAGTVSALVAIGPGTTVPPAPTLPTIVAAPLTRRTATPPPADAIAAMRTRTRCATDVGGPVSNETVALDDKTDLVLLSCGSGAYNFIAKPLLVRDGRTSTASFDLSPQFGEPGAGPSIVNGGYDAKTGLLSTYAKGRGIGDCGVAQDYAWDGTRFRLVEMRQLGECRGGLTWPTVWRATVARP